MESPLDMRNFASFYGSGEVAGRVVRWVVLWWGARGEIQGFFLRNRRGVRRKRTPESRGRILPRGLPLTATVMAPPGMREFSPWVFRLSGRERFFAWVRR